MRFIKKFEKSIQVGDNLQDKLKRSDDSLSKKLKDFLNSNDIKDDANVSKVDYNPEDDKLITIYDEKGKERKFKIGKLLSYLGFNSAVKQYEIENFITNIKKVDIEKLKEVRGEDILHSYNCNNYADGRYGDLQSSCMRYEHKQKFLKIYTSNPNQVSCLTRYNDNGQIEGRALIWNLDGGSRFMDRIYSNNNDIKSEFIKYAEENNISRTRAGNVHLDHSYYDYYPYMDTLIYYVPEEGMLTDTKPEEYEYYELTSTDGNYIEGEGARVYSNRNGEEILESEAVQDYTGDWIYKEDAVIIYYGQKLMAAHKQDDDVTEVSYYSEKYQKMIDKFNEENKGEGFGDNENLHAIKEECTFIEPAGRSYLEWVLIEDKDIYVKVKGETLINYNNDNIPYSYKLKEKANQTAMKDHYGKWQKFSNLISIWSDEDNKMIMVNKKSVDLENIDETHISIDYSCNNTEKCYVPKKLVEEKEGHIIVKPPLLYIKPNRLGVADKGLVEIHKNYYSSERFLKNNGVVTNGTYKIYPPLNIMYSNGRYDSKALPMIRSYLNDYKNYDDYAKRMKLLEETIKDFDYTFSYDSLRQKEAALSHADICLSDYYYFEKAFNVGAKLEKKLIDNGYEQDTDVVFYSTNEDSLKPLKEFVDNNGDKFTSKTLNGYEDKYFNNNYNLELDYPLPWVSYMGLCYKVDDTYVYPYFYSDVEDKFVVKENGEYKFEKVKI